MITREEYIEALTVVEGYHEQLRDTLFAVENHTRVPLRTFMTETAISTRLHTVLDGLAGRDGGTPVYVDEILWLDFRRMRNAGPKLWEEFSTKRERYLHEHRRS